eukprot:9483574-Pyramimonas_sp.AAC.1
MPVWMVRWRNCVRHALPGWSPICMWQVNSTPPHALHRLLHLSAHLLLLSQRTIGPLGRLHCGPHVAVLVHDHWLPRRR